MLAACSLGGAGHLNPLLAFLAAAERRGGQALVVGPPALREMVELAGYPFRAGGEPDAEEVARIREKLPVVSRAEASVLANRELFGRLATRAMLPAMEHICSEWQPDLILRETCEYASAIVGPRLGIRTAQVAISLAEVEAASITTAAPALEAIQKGLVSELWSSTYLSHFPASLDSSPFPSTIRLRVPGVGSGEPLPDWWNGSDDPLI
ncbi:MAG: glycosyltransferase, partial [Chloroflexota bacterium]